MTEQPELKPCPFCGASGVLKEIPFTGHLREPYIHYMAHCSNHACIAYRNQSPMKESVVAAWNRRDG